MSLLFDQNTSSNAERFAKVTVRPLFITDQAYIYIFLKFNDTFIIVNIIQYIFCY